MDDRDGQLETERERRNRIVLFALAAGLVIFAGSVYQDYVVYAHFPTVGLLQALTPTLNGVAKGAADPRSVHLVFTAHHRDGVIFASAIIGVGTLSMIPPLRYLADATRLRGRGQVTWKLFATYGGVLAAALAIVVQIVSTTQARDFVRNGNNSTQAVNHAINASDAYTLGIPATIGLFAFAIGFGAVAYLAMSVGLLNRLLGWLGVIAAVFVALPFLIQEFEPLPIFEIVWCVFLAGLLSDRTSSNLPPAWDAGQAIPWLTQQQVREQREAGGGAPRRRGGQPVSVPAPRLPGTASPNSSKKRKKRR
jgi:hypothetical protein